MARGFLGKKHRAGKTGMIAQAGCNNKTVCVYVTVGEIAVQPTPHPRGDGDVQTWGMGYAAPNDDPPR